MIFIGDYHLSLANVLLTLSAVLLILVVIAMLRGGRKEKDKNDRSNG